MQRVEALLKLIEKAIGSLDFQRSPGNLYHPITYTLSNGGKRIRPLLTLLSCQMFDQAVEKALYPAVGLEVFHNFTLLHDDIMDQAPVRRGKPTVHEKWNANTAILSGDAMMIEAYKLICKTPEKQFKQVVDLFSDTATGVCEGQQYDMDFEQKTTVSEGEYLEMIKLKTSVLLAACLKTGAIIGGASIEDADLLYGFGINLGLAFQIKDDWLDVFGDPEQVGKKNGGDIVVNKKTYLLIRALNKASEEQKRKIEIWLDRVSFNEEEKINAMRKIYNDLNVGEEAINLATSYSEKAFGLLEKVSVSSEKKDIFVQLGHQLLNRTN